MQMLGLFLGVHITEFDKSVFFLLNYIVHIMPQNM